MKKKKILAICSEGINRSKYLANYLRKKGYSMKFGGIKEYAETPITLKKIEWADLIIFAQEKHKKWFEEKFGKLKKPYLIFNVRDSGNDVPENKKDLLELSRKDFNRKWTHPNLRKAVKKYKL